MKETLQPASVKELADAVRSVPRLLPVGAGTKPRLGDVNVPKVSLGRLTGIVEYEPDEYTFTAFAGTTVREIAEVLAARGQYMPFDPPLLEAGATLGGTVAAGLNGAGRFRYGGLRDFILGVRFVDGSGRLLRLGGKVVKNAAGFDVPKFLVGSLGRFGVLAELTFKVFPRPAATRTLRLVAPDPMRAIPLLLELARGRWEADALDVPPGGGVHVRLAGPETALTGLAEEILARWPGESLADTEANRIWSDLREFHWCHPGGWLGKVVLHPAQYPDFSKSLDPWPEARVHLSVGGNVSYVSLPTPQPAATVNRAWKEMNLRVLTLRGSGALWLGTTPINEIQSAVKLALDPDRRFPDLEE